MLSFWAESAQGEPQTVKSAESPRTPFTEIFSWQCHAGSRGFPTSFRVCAQKLSRARVPRSETPAPFMPCYLIPWTAEQSDRVSFVNRSQS